jgi:hypothetical protein
MTFRGLEASRRKGIGMRWSAGWQNKEVAPKIFSSNLFLESKKPVTPR